MNGSVPPAPPAPVYIVEDDRPVGEALRFLLRLEGLTVQLFDGAEVFLARHSRPTRGCIIVDQYMPGMTGLDLARTLRRRGCALRIALITGRLDAGLERRAVLAGVDDILEKPLIGTRLVETVAEGLRLAALRSEPPTSA